MRALQLLLIFTSLYIIPHTALSKDKLDTETVISFELLLEQLSRDFPQSIDADELEYYYQFPIYPIPANRSKLLSLPLIDEQVIDYILKYKYTDRSDIVQRFNLSEQQEAILYYTVQTIDLEKGNYKIDSTQIDAHEFKLSYRLRSVTPLETKTGFENGNYLGDRIDYYQRLILGYEGWQANILTAKDPGEQSYTDFLSGGLSYNSENYSLILGDFMREWGLGAMNNRVFGSRKGGEVIATAYRSGEDFRLNTSSIPQNIMRGAKASGELEISSGTKLSSSLWYSDQQLDASKSESGLITSIDRTGYRFTQNDIDKVGILGERIIGASALVSDDALYEIGVAYQNLAYSDTLFGASGYFQGLSNNYLSAISAVNLDDFSFSSEAVFNQQGGPAYLASLKYTVDAGEYTKSKVTFLLNGRYLSESYNSPYGNTFGEFSGVGNEAGIYLGAYFRQQSGISYGTYIDFYRSIGNRSGSLFPVEGFDWLGQFRWKANTDNELIIRGRYERKKEIEEAAISIADGYHDRYSLRSDYISNSFENLRIRVRGELAIADEDEEDAYFYSYLASLDLDYDISERWAIGLRHTQHKVPDFSAAIWQYEYVFPGYSTSPVLLGEGSRTTAEMYVGISAELAIRARYALDYRIGDDPFLGGNEGIAGNIRSSIALQLDWNTQFLMD